MEELYLLSICLPLKEDEVRGWLESLRGYIAELLSAPIESISIFVAESLEQAERLLIEKPISCIFAGTQSEELQNYIQTLKRDELFKYLPVVLFASHGADVNVGNRLPYADLVLKIESPLESIINHLRPIFRAKIVVDELVRKNSLLQDELMHKNLLIELIKRYIPKTVWDRATTFAYEQTIFIPHYEENVAILFGDIEGFTQMAERRSPREVIDLLNEAYSIIAQIVYERGGDIDKFIGDAFLAVHPEPLDSIAMALRIQDQLKDKAVKFRLGIHYGPVIRGNVGSDLRSDNTLIGDTVNTAARIQEHCPAGEVLVSEEAVTKAGIEIPPPYRQQLRFRGKEEPLTVCNVYRFCKTVHFPSCFN